MLEKNYGFTVLILYWPNICGIMVMIINIFNILNTVMTASLALGSACLTIIDHDYFNYLFVHRRPTHKFCFLSCRPFVVSATFSTGLVVPSVSWVGS